MVSSTYSGSGVLLRPLRNVQNSCVPIKGDICRIHYEVFLEPENGFTSLSDTAPIDSSIGRDVVVEFTVGSGQVILGLDVAIQSMAVGGVYELTIPTCYAYGESGFPPSIPPNAVLVYIVELLSIVEKKMFTDGLVVPGHKM